MQFRNWCSNQNGYCRIVQQILESSTYSRMPTNPPTRSDCFMVDSVHQVQEHAFHNFTFCKYPQVQNPNQFHLLEQNLPGRVEIRISDDRDIRDRNEIMDGIWLRPKRSQELPGSWEFEEALCGKGWLDRKTNDVVGIGMPWMYLGAHSCTNDATVWAVGRERWAEKSQRFPIIVINFLNLE